MSLVRQRRTIVPSRPIAIFIPDEDSSLKWIAFITDEHFQFVVIPVQRVDLEVVHRIVDDHRMARMIAQHVVVRFGVNGRMNT